MSVDLVSLPPVSRGAPSVVEKPGSEAEAVKAKLQSKVETKPETPHVAEVEAQKKTPTKKSQVQPRTQVKESKSAAKTDAAGAGAEKLGLPEGVEMGSEFGAAKVEGGTFETPTYLNILFAKIKYRWENPFEGQEKTSCVIYFSIMRNGSIIDATIEQSSGIAAFDQSALRAVLSSRPPPLPLEYTGEQLGVHLEFQYLP